MWSSLIALAAKFEREEEIVHGVMETAALFLSSEPHIRRKTLSFPGLIDMLMGWARREHASKPLWLAAVDALFAAYGEDGALIDKM